MKININQPVRVKFTPVGQDIAMRTYCTQRQMLSGEFSFHDLMNLFGPYMYPGGPVIFESGSVEFVEPLIQGLP
jgi:hypothetical protein